jgi:hypothetical protein
VRSWIHWVFITVWGVSVAVFGILAHESYGAMNVELAGYSANVPVGGPTILLGDADIAAILNGISNAFNKNAQLLQDSIQRSAKLTFWLNVVSCLMACGGLAAEFFAYRHDRGRLRASTLYDLPA